MQNNSHKFIEFLTSLYESDTNLINVILDGYLTIFESFADSSNSVFKAYEELLDTKELPQRIKLSNGIYAYKTTTHLDGIEIGVIFKDGNSDYRGQNDVGGYADTIDDIKCIEIIHSSIPDAIDNNNLQYYKYILHDMNIKYTIMHELGHLYEFSKRTEESVNNQVNPLNNINNPYMNDQQYHVNHKIERIAHKVSIFSGIIDALYLGFLNESEILRYLKTHEPYSEYINVLNDKNKQSIMLRISALIYKVLNGEFPELKDTINRIKGK